MLFAFAQILMTPTFGVDLELADGRTLKDYKVINHNAVNAMIIHEGGADTIPLELLPDDLKEKYGYNKKEAAKKINEIRIEDQNRGIEKRRQDIYDTVTRLLIKSHDEIKEIDWYKSKFAPDTNKSKSIHTYIGKKGNRLWLRLKMSYYADDWLFIDSVDFKIDDEHFSIRESTLQDWERDNSGGAIWEWIDKPVDQNNWKILNKIADSETAVMRYNGDQYRSDREISEIEKLSIKNVILAYTLMGGKPPE